MKTLITLLTLLFAIQGRAQTLLSEHCLNKKGKEITKCKKAYSKVLTYQLPGDTIKIEEYRILENQLISRKFYSGETPVGVWFELGFKGKEIIYDFTALIYTETSNYTIENDVDHDAFIGANKEESQQEIIREIANNFRMPKQATSGKVYAKYAVLPSGKVQFISILKSAGIWLDIEIKRCIEDLPDFTPAKKNGKPVTAYYIFPFRFRGY